MGASSPERRTDWGILLRALLIGAALGIIAFAGGGVILYASRGLIAASVGLVATLAAALAGGVWAGAPTADAEPSPLPGRWLVAGLATGASGLVATAVSLLGAASLGVGGRIGVLLLMIALPTYAIGLLLPPLLVWAERREEETGDAAGFGVLGVLVLGAVAGVGVGSLLAGVIASYSSAGSLLLGTGLLLSLPAMLPERTAPRAAERTVFQSETPFGTVRVVEVTYPGERQPERRLFLNDEEESGELVRSGAPTLAYIAAAERWLAEVSRPGDAYLFLGGGAYTLPRRVAERDPGAAITTVELDPEVTRVAGRFFGLRPQHRITALHGDARAVVEALPGAYDRIFLDVYDGRESLPYSLVTREAFEVLARRLRPGGTLALNVIGTVEGEGSRRFWSVVRTLGESFPSVALYVGLDRDHPERQNALLVAAREPERGFPPRAGLFERWPREEWPRAAGTVVFRDHFPEAGAPRREQRGESSAPVG